MPPPLYEWLDGIKTVEREYGALQFAAKRVMTEAERDPTILTRDLQIGIFRQASDRLEGTYTLRLFAQFEAGLRSFWTSARSKETPWRTRDLVDGVAATRRIDQALVKAVHDVREYRNSLIHERAAPIDPLPIAVARGHLCRFLSYLPPNW